MIPEFETGLAAPREGTRSMSRGISLKATILALLSLPFANAAIAGVAENAGGVVDLWKRSAPVAKAQYYSSDYGDLCWYDQGWRGPGWYLCGDEWDYGVGWFGGHRNRHRHLRYIGTARPEAASHHAVRAADRPGFRIAGVHFHHPRAFGLARPGPRFGHVSIAHEFGAARPLHHSYGGAGPVVHSWGGPSAVVPNSGGAPAFHSFAAPPAPSANFGGGGSHGFGGASFPSAAHGGGMGH